MGQNNDGYTGWLTYQLLDRGSAEIQTNVLRWDLTSSFTSEAWVSQVLYDDP